jgi:hypothetical protein
MPSGAKGSFNETIPGGCASLGFEGQLRVTIDCLDVNGNHADMHGMVTKATGSFAEDGFTEGGPAFISTTEDAISNMDSLGVKPTSDVLKACGRTLNEPLILNGSINVHDA